MFFLGNLRFLQSMNVVQTYIGRDFFKEEKSLKF